MQELPFKACSQGSHILYSDYCELRIINMTQASAKETSSESSKKKLAKISPETIVAVSESEEFSHAGELASERVIIEAARLLLREYGIRKSGAAIRDAIEIPHTKIGPKEAVNALSNLGFKASFGSLNINTLTEEFFSINCI